MCLLSLGFHSFCRILNKSSCLLISSEWSALSISVFSLFIRGDVDAHVSDPCHLLSQPERLFSDWIFHLLFKSLNNQIHIVSGMEVVWVIPVISFQLKETNEVEQCNRLPDSYSLISAARILCILLTRSYLNSLVNSHAFKYSLLSKAYNFFKFLLRSFSILVDHRGYNLQIGSLP